MWGLGKGLGTPGMPVTGQYNINEFFSFCSFIFLSSWFFCIVCIVVSIFVFVIFLLIFVWKNLLSFFLFGFGLDISFWCRISHQKSSISLQILTRLCDDETEVWKKVVDWVKEVRNSVKTFNASVCWAFINVLMFYLAVLKGREWHAWNACYTKAQAT